MKKISNADIFAEHISTRLTAGLAIIFTLLLTSCSSRYLAFKVDAELYGRDTEGIAWNSSPTDFSRHLTKAAIDEGSTFANRLAYTGANFNLSVSVLEGGMRMIIENKQSVAMCLRLDTATLQSNLGGAPLPLKVWSAFFHQGGMPPRYDKIRYASEKATDRGPERGQSRGQVSYILEPYCIAPQTMASFTLVIDAYRLYPNAQIFNVRRVSDRIIESGIGNTLKFNLPLEVDGKPQEFEIHFKAVDEIYFGESARSR
jgi:hypothetical protein